MSKVVLDFQLGTIYMVNQQLTHPSVGPPPVLTPLSGGHTQNRYCRFFKSCVLRLFISPDEKIRVPIEKSRVLRNSAFLHFIRARTLLFCNLLET